MKEATCKKCETTKRLSEFYKSQYSRVSGLGECAECTKARVRANREANIGYYREYDKDRAMLPHRVAARVDYQQTPAGIQAGNRAKKAWAERNPIKKAAANMVSNAVRDGKLEKSEFCEVCRSADCRIEGHHDDYSKPLDVRWLCSACHSSWHKENGEART